jgi:hypothetical protein
LSRLKIAVIHNTSVIDRHSPSPESIFGEHHHITSVHKQSFCETLTQVLSFSQLNSLVMCRWCDVFIQLKLCHRAQPGLQVRLEANTAVVLQP